MQDRNPAVQIRPACAATPLLSSECCVFDVRRIIKLPNICSVNINFTIRSEGCQSAAQITETHHWWIGSAECCCWLQRFLGQLQSMEQSFYFCHRLQWRHRHIILYPAVVWNHTCLPSCDSWRRLYVGCHQLDVSWGTRKHEWYPFKIKLLENRSL